MNVLDFKKRKAERRPITMVTCYDHWSAKIIVQTPIDTVLVGDSVSMVVHGYPSTVHATPEMMEMHVAAVARGLKSKFLVGDMPFLSFRRGPDHALGVVDRLIKAGAQAVKLEGVWGHEETVDQIVRSGVPVLGHIGLTPQSLHQFGGFRVQGRDEEAAQDLLRQAKRLEELGCCSVVLECVPAQVAEAITRALEIPTIGIGAGAQVDGQVLVLQDMLGMSGEFKPKFLRHYLKGEEQVREALRHYHQSVIEGIFPSEEECYT
jgi:3-methyl-2-oxobutanoate hydroxymethyltransferase